MLFRCSSILLSVVLMWSAQVFIDIGCGQIDIPTNLNFSSKEYVAAEQSNIQSEKGLIKNYLIHSAYAGPPFRTNYYELWINVTLSGVKPGTDVHFEIFYPPLSKNSKENPVLIYENTATSEVIVKNELIECFKFDPGACDPYIGWATTRITVGLDASKGDYEDQIVILGPHIGYNYNLNKSDRRQVGTIKCKNDDVYYSVNVTGVKNMKLGLRTYCLKTGKPIEEIANRFGTYDKETKEKTITWRFSKQELDKNYNCTEIFIKPILIYAKPT